MIQDYFCNHIERISRDPQVQYLNGKAVKTYQKIGSPIACRIGSLNNKDYAALQFLDKTEGVKIEIRKLYTSSDIELKVKDKIERESKNYEIISVYSPQNQHSIHHKKYYIKLVD